MLDEWRLEIPASHRRKWKHIYYLEIIYHHRNNFSHFSLFHREVQYQQFKAEHRKDGSLVHQWNGKLFTVTDLRSYAYNFDGSGKLVYVSHHYDDFTAPGFRWSEGIRHEFGGDEITDEHRKKASDAADKVLFHLKLERNNVEPEKERQRYELFVSALEKIVKASSAVF